MNRCVKIEVIGSGCKKCRKLFELTKQAAEELGLGDVEYIKGEEGIKRIIELGAMKSPLIVIDGKIVMQGLADKEKIKSVLGD